MLVCSFIGIKAMNYVHAHDADDYEMLLELWLVQQDYDDFREEIEWMYERFRTYATPEQYNPLSLLF